MIIRRNLLLASMVVGATIFSLDAVAQIQNTVYGDVNRSIIRVKKQTGDEVTGSPYLIEDWQKGNVKFKNNTYARNGELKYDVMEDILVVKGADGVENVFSDPVDEFTLNVDGKSRLFKTGFTGEKGVNPGSYLEVIANGKYKLLKRHSKGIIESRVYNSATVTKKYDESSVYYIAKEDNKLIPVKKNEKAILEVLNKPELAKYTKDNKLNLKNEEDIAKLFAYNDTL